MRWLDRRTRKTNSELLPGDAEGAHFLRAVDTTGNEKDAKFIFYELKKVIEEIGSEHIVAVIMDGASANTSATELLEIE